MTFDGTICDPEHIVKGYRMGQPMPGAVLYLNKLHQAGHQIVIFTARNVNQPTAKKAVADWLDFFQIPYHGITNIKEPYFDVMIDNRAIQFTGNWQGMLTKLEKFGTNKLQASNRNA